ncbi:PREDICTED: uncharacterized protein LOC108774776 [Cyphomyrmex costatus]|uniref:uncharacterized protein LOC108774776 n=1 Tax=Cyphomyrmex costatus TaxID=456900 RepID=UPI0008523A77|nr:PREDICTED: uncharacterized protein LOC108774776 [Cyphomyrmex costatus]
MYKNEQCRNRKVNDAYFDFDASNVHRYILLQSPKISFNFNQYTDDSLFYEKLCSSPMKDKHKHLFKKYKRKYRPLSELPATLSDFSKSWNSMSGWLSPRAHSIKCGRISFKGKSLSPLYFRLLHHSKLDLKRSRENVSRNQSVNYEGLNLTPTKRPLQGEHLTSCDDKIRNLFSSPS